MIWFLIPCYNEAQNLPLLKENLLAALPREEKHYVFVDDGSSDDSVDLTRSLFEGQPCTILQNDRNRGPGYTFNHGFQHITTQAADSDLIVTLEADNTSDTNILPHMTEICRMGYGLVLASVYAQGGGLEKTNFIRKVISFCANLVMRFAFDIKVQTLSSFYRVYSVELVKKIQDKYGNAIDQPGFVCMLEFLVKAIHCKAQVIEVPMVLKSSMRKGRSKMKIFKTSMEYLKFLSKFKKV